MYRLRASLAISIFFAINFLMITDISSGNPANKAKLNDQPSGNSSFVSRFKRQFMPNCPSGCFPSCHANSQCQQFAPRMICIQACCCPVPSPSNLFINPVHPIHPGHPIHPVHPGGINIIPVPVPVLPPSHHNIFDLNTACDGGPAAAACINGLCGQGFFCNNRGFCCRCASGNSTGPCINNLCPAGYSCNSNNYCCPLGSGAVLGPCINQQCPTGYACGAGNLCYLVTRGG